MSAYILGLKSVAFAAVTNPASGLSEGFTHDGEENLIAAKRCLDGLGKTMFKIIADFQLNPDYKLTNHIHGALPIKMKRVSSLPSDEIVEKLI